MRALKFYDKLLVEHPIKTKSVTSGFLFGLGDFICQNFIEKNEKKYDVKRTLKLTARFSTTGTGSSRASASCRGGRRRNRRSS